MLSQIFIPLVRRFRVFNQPHRISRLYCNNATTENRQIAPKELFGKVQQKNRNTFLDTIKIFVNRDAVYRRGHVEFIYAALNHMEEFGVVKDLQVYKALIDVLPKGKFIPTNIIQAEFMHYPKQQQCIIDLLEQMEDYGVIPDLEMEDILVNIFGKRGFPLRKYWRMMYWLPKFKKLSPWPLPDELPDSLFDLAKLAVDRMMCADPLSVTTVYETRDVVGAVDKTWIVSGQSPRQKKLLVDYKDDDPVYVEGPFKIWLRDKSLDYFVLRGKILVKDKEENLDDVSKIEVPTMALRPPVWKKVSTLRSPHEQDDGVIFALCITGSSSKDSLLSWIRLLDKDGNPKLAKTPVVFTFKQPVKDVTVKDCQTSKIE